MWSDSSGLLFWEVDLQICKSMTNMLALVEHANWVLLAWNSTLVIVVNDKNDVSLA